ncbi:MAG: PQQ-like beta-propeller repeat protein, partial [Pirellulales bacterium]|nr:PQQ-like beta-propeller repeat protein [Pirellulales bacterium]
MKIAVGGLVAAVWAPIGPAAAADWPLIRGNEAATGVASEPLPATLDILWTYAAEGSGFEATASIAGGVVYVGDVDGTFHAVKLDGGGPVWTRQFAETGFVAGSAFAEGRLYCVDFNGVVRALDAKSGEPLWEFPTETSLYAAPNVYEGTVLIAAESGQLFALDAATGAQKWEPFSIDQPLRCWPTVVGGQALIAGCDGRLHLVDVKTGAAGPSIEIGGPADGMPAVVGDRVYFCTAAGVFHAMTINPLADLWQYGHRGQGEEIHAAAVTDNRVVLGTHDKRMVALDRQTGKEAWAMPLRSR